MEGFIDCVGVRVLEQLEDDWAKAERKSKPSKAAKETCDILKEYQVYIVGMLEKQVFQMHSNRIRRTEEMRLLKGTIGTSSHRVVIQTHRTGGV